jgi:hypothetical protein
MTIPQIEMGEEAAGSDWLGSIGEWLLPLTNGRIAGEIEDRRSVHLGIIFLAMSSWALSGFHVAKSIDFGVVRTTTSVVVVVSSTVQCKALP